jgi:hypothetical protein
LANSSCGDDRDSQVRLHNKIEKKIKIKLNAELHFFYKWMKLAMAKLMDVEMFLDVFKQN